MAGDAVEKVVDVAGDVAESVADAAGDVVDKAKDMVGRGDDGGDSDGDDDN